MSSAAKPGLTAQQDKLLRFIEASLAEGRVAPSFEAMKDHVGVASKSGVHRLVSALEERGYITRVPHRARAIALASPLAKVPAYELMAELRRRGIAVRVDVA